MQLKSIPILVTVLALSWLGTAAGGAQPAAAPGSQFQPQVKDSGAILVELFTSEGCSSCPPADALLREIDGKYAAGRLIVGVSEHVTYWNQLGWSDPFSDASYTERQSGYGRKFRLDSVYTPQMVIDGEEQITGSDGRALLNAIQTEKQRKPLSIHILSAGVEGDALNVNFAIDGDLPKRGADVFLVLADDSDRSDVLRGENSGQGLTHVSVARAISRVTAVKSSENRTIRVPLPPSSRAQAARPRHMILFAQTPDMGPVLGVVVRKL
jgi:hypothetical protein